MRSSACPYTVHFFGALFREGDVWICMEVMDTSLDKFYVKLFKNDRDMPEDILGKVSFCYFISSFYPHFVETTLCISLSLFLCSNKKQLIIIFTCSCFFLDCNCGCECTTLFTCRTKMYS